MSVRAGLLALLDRGDRYGYQLRAEFEARTGGTWPLNVGQVYTTLARLERDGLVESAGETAEGQRVYAITAVGRKELREWFAAPVARRERPRDELTIKVAMALVVEGVDVAAVLQAQRADTIRTLQEYAALKARIPETDLARQLVVDALVFQAEAEIRWVDLCEQRITSDRRESARSRKASQR